jgi:hypothetical protein
VLIIVDLDLEPSQPYKDVVATEATVRCFCKLMFAAPGLTMMNSPPMSAYPNILRSAKCVADQLEREKKGRRRDMDKKGADDCLPKEDLQRLRSLIVDEDLSDEVAEELSAAIAVGERIRSCDYYVDDALGRLNFIAKCALQKPPRLILAREERSRLQIDCYRNYRFISGFLARITNGSPGGIALAALISSLIVWMGVVIGIRALVDVATHVARIKFFGFDLSGILDLVYNIFFMNQTALAVVVSAAFLGGVVSIATRLNEFARVRDLDPFAMFWTALLKPLIGVVVSVFILAALAGGITSFLDLDPLAIASISESRTQGPTGGSSGAGSPDAKTSSSSADASPDHAKSKRTQYILWVIGFLSGFSERFAWDFVDRARGIVNGGAASESKKKS